MKIIESVRMTAHNSKEVRYVDDPVAYDVPEHAKNEHIELIAEWEKNNTPIPFVEPIPSVSDRRRVEYPPATDYLDGVVKGDQAQIDKYVSDCLAIKEKFPKE
jgi:hypothetical protein